MFAAQPRLKAPHAAMTSAARTPDGPSSEVPTACASTPQGPSAAPVRTPRALETAPLFHENEHTLISRLGEYRFVEPSLSRIRAPTTLGKALLAEDYHRRYGVEIFIVPYWRNLPTVARQLFESRPGDFKLGLVVHAGGEFDHAASFLLARRDGTRFVAAFDSTGPGNCLEPTCRSLERLVDTVMWVEASARGWQADNHSCHTSALVILKDLLRRPDPITDLGSPSGHRNGLPVHPMPSFLLKIAQRSNALAGVNMREVVGFGPNGQAKTLEAHRARHTSEVEIEPVPEESRCTLPNERGTRRVNLYALHKGAIYANRAERLRRELSETPGGADKLQSLWETRVLEGPHR